MATTCRGRSDESSAQSATTPRARSQPEPPGAAHDVGGLEVVARAELVDERAAQVVLDLLARLGERDLGETGDRREVQVFGGVRGRGLATPEQQDRPDELVAAADRRFGGDDDGHAGGPVADAVGHVAAQVVQSGVLAAGERGRAEARNHDRHGRTRRLGGEPRDALQAVAVQHGLDHLQVHLPQAREVRGPDGARGDRARAGP